MKDYLEVNFTTPRKTKSWRESLARKIAQNCGSDDKEKELMCVRYYNGDINEGDYDYLRKIGKEYEMPARVRFIPIVRQNINNLVSQEARRGFFYKPYTVDKDNIDRKLKRKAYDILQVIDLSIDRKLVQYNTAMKQLEMKEQQIQSILQQQPQSQEEAQQVEAMREIAPQLQMELEVNKKALENEIFVSSEDIQKVEAFYRSSPSDMIEEKADKLLRYAATDTTIDIRRQINRGFEKRLVDGHELYYIDILPDHKFPVFKKMDAYNVYWSGDGDNEWVQDGQWVALHFHMSPSAIIDFLGEDLDEATLQKLSYYVHGLDYRNVRWNKETGVVYTNPSRDLYGGTKITKGIDVWHVIWKAGRRIKVKFTPNPYMPGKFFKHFYDESENVVVNKKRGEFLKVRWVNDLYEAVVIGNNKVVRAGKRQYQLRNPDTLEVKLPVVGESFNGQDKPYSLIWITRDIQELYNLLNYHRELMFALAGVKGIVMDYAQKPDEFTDEEWLYMRKQGLTLIDSLKRKNGRFASFNQFQTYDDTISPSVQYIDAMLESLQRLVDEITGVSYQRKGMTVSTDQVGTNQLAMQQSVLTTEILFYQHDETVRRALEQWLNLTKTVLDDDMSFAYYMNGQPEMFNLPAYIFENADFRIGVVSSSKDEHAMVDLKQIAMNGYARGQLALEEVVKIYSTDNLHELERKIAYYAEKTAKAAAMAEQNRIQAEEQMKKNIIQFEKEYDAIIAKQEQQLEAAKIQIQEAELALKEKEQKLNEYVEQANLKLKEEEILAEQQSEMGYLAEQTRAAKTDELLKSVQIMIDAYMSGKKIDKDAEVALKKVQFSEPKKANKEKIKA